MIYPLVQDLAADKIPVAVTCRVLGFSTQAFYKWQANPVSQRDWDDAHLINAAIDIYHDDPEFGYRFICRRARRPGPAGLAQPGSPAVQFPGAVGGALPQAGPAPQARSASARGPGAARLRRRAAQPAVADRHHRTSHRRG